MTSLTVTAPLAVASPTAITPPVFGLRIIIGLVGVLLAVLVSGLNEMVTKVALADIRGALAIGYDEGTWLVASYTATSVAAMAFAPWCSVTFSLRRFTLYAIGIFTLLGVLCPFAPNYESLLLMRILQGLAGGALPPMLMTVALRFLPANVKLYGLAGYALTATFGPGLGTPLAGLWTEYVGWQWTLANHRTVPDRHGGGGLRFASGPTAPGALKAVQLAWFAIGLSGDLHAGDRHLAGQSAGLVRIEPHLLFARRRVAVAGAVPDQRMVAADSVFQVADARHPQPVVCFDDPCRGVGGAVGGGDHSLQLPGAGPGLSADSDRADHAAGGTPTIDRAAVGGGAVQPALGRLPLGAGDWPEHAGVVLPRWFATDLGVDSRRFLPPATAANLRSAHGGVAAADAFHRQHHADGRAVRLGLVQHRQRPGRGDRHRRTRCADHLTVAFPLDHVGRQPR